MTLTRLSQRALADQIGTLDAEVKAVQSDLKAAKAEFTRRNVPTITGTLYTIKQVEAVRCSLDQTAIKNEFGEDWIAARSKFTPTVSVRITVNKEALVAA
jgi:hypothetical protein